MPFCRQLPAVGLWAGPMRRRRPNSEAKVGNSVRPNRTCNSKLSRDSSSNGRFNKGNRFSRANNDKTPSRDRGNNARVSLRADSP